MMIATCGQSLADGFNCHQKGAHNMFGSKGWSLDFRYIFFTDWIQYIDKQSVLYTVKIAGKSNCRHFE